MNYHEISCTQFSFPSARETRGYTVRDVITAFERAHLMYPDAVQRAADSSHYSEPHS